MACQKRLVKYVTIKQFSPGVLEGVIKINPIYNTEVDRSPKSEHSISSARVSLRRAHKNLDEILRCNSWKYFITLTFGFEGRLADQLCRNEFSKWSKMMRDKYPWIYYVAVPEYHKKGGLHYHIVLGGIGTVFDALGLVDSGKVLHFGRSWDRDDFFESGFEVDTLTGEGLPIYNVTSWTVGFSTATKVRNVDAVSRYVSKYLSKADIDPRFYKKKRFHCSQNCARPLVLKMRDVCDDVMDDYGLDACYAKSSFGLRKYESLSKEDIIRMRLSGELPFDNQ